MTGQMTGNMLDGQGAAKEFADNLEGVMILL
jgi:hypothetical protein